MTPVQAFIFTVILVAFGNFPQVEEEFGLRVNCTVDHLYLSMIDGLSHSLSHSVSLSLGLFLSLWKVKKPNSNLLHMFQRIHMQRHITCYIFVVDPFKADIASYVYIRQPPKSRVTLTNAKCKHRWNMLFIILPCLQHVPIPRMGEGLDLHRVLCRRGQRLQMHQGGPQSGDGGRYNLSTSNAQFAYGHQFWCWLSESWTLFKDINCYISSLVVGI